MTTVTSTDYVNSTQSEVSRNKLAQDLDTFLFILTEQLKNQDPLSPMDSTEFTNQLVQYASVEQAIETNKNLENLLTMTRSSLAVSAMGYVGNTVQIDSDQLPLQDGEAKMSYYLPEEAKTCAVIIKDIASGGIVAVIEGDTYAGKHTIEWDGINNNGVQLPDGAYQIQVTAYKKDGSSMENIGITSYGKVTGVASDGTDIAIGVGDVVVTLDKILAIHAPETKKASDTNSNTDSNANNNDSSGDDSNDTIEDNG